MGTTNIMSRALFAGARILERASGLLRGKGYGSHSIAREASFAVRMLGDTPRLVIDVGGNRGDYAGAILDRAPECEVVVFEPAAGNCRRLTERFSNNPRVKIEGHGLSDKEGKATLFSNEEGSGIASLSKRDLSHIGVEMDLEEKVSLISFDQYWRDHLNKAPIDIMKFDVEGHELWAMKGANEALSATTVVQFEFGGCNIDSRTFFRDFYNFFNDLSFDLYRITPFGLEPLQSYSEDLEFFITTNFLARRQLT